jgi:hypothetical protein
VLFVYYRAGWLLGANDFDASIARASSSSSSSNFEFVACRCVSAEEAEALVRALASLVSLGLHAAKVPTGQALALSAPPGLPQPRPTSLDSVGFVVAVAPTATALAASGGSLRAWVAWSDPPQNDGHLTVIGKLLKALSSADPQAGHPDDYTFPERGFASPEVMFFFLLFPIF